MTLFDVEELCGYWREHPPVHLLLAAFIGVKPESHREDQATPVADRPAMQMLAAIPGMEPSANDDMPPPVFDAAELFKMRP